MQSYFYTRHQEKAIRSKHLPAGKRCLEDFILDLSSQIFNSLPPELQTLTHRAVQQDLQLLNKYLQPLHSATDSQLLNSIPISASQSLKQYSIIGGNDNPGFFFKPVILGYINAAKAPKPKSCKLSKHGTAALTKHYLTRQYIQQIALQRAWCRAEDPRRVAKPYHGYHRSVHQSANNEALAGQYWSVGLLQKNEKVTRLARTLGGFVGKIK